MKLSNTPNTRITKNDFNNKSALEIARDIVGMTLVVDDTKYSIDGILLYHEDTVEHADYYGKQTTVKLRREFDQGEIYTVYSMGKPLAGIKLGAKASIKTSGDSAALFFERLSKLTSNGSRELVGKTRSEVAHALGLVKGSALLGENILDSKRIYISKEKSKNTKPVETFNAKDNVIRQLEVK